ncbi:MAG: hypothetical protein ACRCXZ_06140, partial [Patescibacteria group bacterium]
MKTNKKTQILGFVRELIKKTFSFISAISLIAGTFLIFPLIAPIKPQAAVPTCSVANPGCLSGGTNSTLTG